MKEILLNDSVSSDLIENRFLSRRAISKKFFIIYEDLSDLFYKNRDILETMNRDLFSKVNNKYVSIDIEMPIYELVN